MPNQVVWVYLPTDIKKKKSKQTVKVKQEKVEEKGARNNILFVLLFSSVGIA